MPRIVYDLYVEVPDGRPGSAFMPMVLEVQQQLGVGSNKLIVRFTEHQLEQLQKADGKLFIEVSALRQFVEQVRREPDDVAKAYFGDR